MGFPLGEVGVSLPVCGQPAWLSHQKAGIPIQEVVRVQPFPSRDAAELLRRLQGPQSARAGSDVSFGDLTRGGVG